MNTKPIPLAERRNRLITQAAAQRTALAQHIQPWRIPLKRVDKGLATLRIIRRHPLWLVSGAILLVTLRAERAGKWMGRAWIAWKLMRKLRQ